jgi:hypothetical protein
LEKVQRDLKSSKVVEGIVTEGKNNNVRPYKDEFHREKHLGQLDEGSQSKTDSWNSLRRIQKFS